MLHKAQSLAQKAGDFSGRLRRTSLLTSRPIAVFLVIGIRFLPDPNRTQKIIAFVSCFAYGWGMASADDYLGHPISRAEAEQRMLAKLTRSLTEDIDPLLPAGVGFSEDDAIEAFGRVWNELVVRIKGDAWKLTDKVIGELREKKYPKLLK